MAFLFACFFPAACSTPEPFYKPVSVTMPVSVPCVTPVLEAPAPALRQVSIHAPLFDKVRAALVEIDERKAYEAQIEAGLAACR